MWSRFPKQWRRRRVHRSIVCLKFNDRFSSSKVPTCVSVIVGTVGSISTSGFLSLRYDGNKFFIVIPNTGYHVADVFVNESSVGASGSCTVQNIMGETAVSATFALEPTPVSTPAVASSSSTKTSTSSTLNSSTFPTTTQSSSPKPISITPEFSMFDIFGAFHSANYPCNCDFA
jgi:hypothetical protein